MKTFQDYLDAIEDKEIAKAYEKAFKNDPIRKQVKKTDLSKEPCRDWADFCNAGFIHVAADDNINWDTVLETMLTNKSLE